MTQRVDLVLHLSHLQLAELVIDDLGLSVNLGSKDVKLRIGVTGQGVRLIDNGQLILITLRSDSVTNVAAARGDLAQQLVVTGLNGVDDLLRG